MTSAMWGLLPLLLLSAGSVAAPVAHAAQTKGLATAAAIAPAKTPDAPPLTTAEQALRTALAGGRYVAMGSSYAAGPMLPPGKPGMAVRCGQSANNYPSLLAKKLNLALVDHSCSGATTDHILGPWGEIPPQISGVNTATKLVTLTIGGNDLTYVGNLFNATCLQSHRRTEAPGMVGATPCNPVRVPTEADYQRDEVQLTRIAQRIHQLAPQARLVFVQYLQPLPASGKLCADTPVSETDADTIRIIGRRLSEIIDRVGRTNDALVVEMDKSSASHTPCDAQPWMIGSPKGYDGRYGLQWHLNLAGMQATADGIAYWLANPSPATPPAIPETDPAPEPASAISPAPVPNDRAKPAPPA